jgi:hypothetical protein
VYSVELCAQQTYLDRFPPENEKSFGSLGEESCEFVDKNVLDFVGLLDFDAYADAVDTRLNKDLLMLVSGHRQWIQ